MACITQMTTQWIAAKAQVMHTNSILTTQPQLPVIGNIFDERQVIEGRRQWAGCPWKT